MGETFSRHGSDAMPGPLPNASKRRRNAPTIPTTDLPSGGRQGAPPELPSWVALAGAGSAWWAWAWATPQAAAWSTGDEVAIARRASLEDDLEAVASVEGLDFTEVLEEETAAKVRTAIGRLAALVTGRVAIMREMRELDDRLGLTPKGRAAQRWRIVGEPEPARAGVPVLADYRAATANGA